MKRGGVRLESFAHAWRGIRYALKTQANLRFHALATAGVLSAGLWTGLTSGEWGLLFLAIGLVWVAELLNTAIERVVDLVSPEYQELAKQAKDCAAGAVLFAALISVLIGIIVFLPKISSWL
jgi:diacylglycerol kinase (ATP)